MIHRLGLAAAFVAAVASSSVLPAAGQPAGPTPLAIDDGRVVPRNQAEIQLSFAPIVRAAAPAVVNVYARETPAERDDFWQQFGTNNRVQQSLGSGVIVDATGLVVTNYHVVADAGQIRVALADGTELPAELVLAEELMDLAILRIPETQGPYPVVPIANSDEIAVGDLVLAIGNPFGFGQTVTSGIISGLGRTIAAGIETQFFIQTDAAINPGNSGGAMIDMAGRLVGINTAIFTRQGATAGISFAIPSNLVQLVMTAAQAGETIHRPWIGAGFEQVTFEAAQRAGLNQPHGATVAFVMEDSPAALAGLQVNDVVVALDGVPLDHPSAFAYRLLLSGIGKGVALTVARDGQRFDIPVTPVAAPETVPRDEVRIAGRSPVTGALVANLSPLVAQELGHPGLPEGVIIVRVLAGSFADSAGLRRGDVIVSINGTPIDSTQQLVQLAAANPVTWEIEVQRDGRTLTSSLSIRR